MTPSCCTSVVSGFILIGPSSLLVFGIAAWRSAALAAGLLGARIGAWPGPSLRSYRSSCRSLAGVVQRLVVVEL